MRRRSFLSSLPAIALYVFSTAGLAAEGDEQTAFVRELYEREIRSHLSRTGASEAEFLSVFSREVQDLWRAERASHVEIPAGPILHAFFGWGVLPGQKVSLVSVKPRAGASGAAVVVVDLAVRDMPRQTLVHLVKENGRWRISNLSYDRGEDFVAFQRRLRGK